ncbi:histone PARylation factor 1-like [Amphiura filiformis]|uniref:histone PARylation factor 1-like n=1 Tax=Amphiura filiformis TaxID=82378 RepID=UPI003B216B89
MEDDSDKTPCKYGAECFRKNKEHLANFSHPPKAKRKSEEGKQESKTKKTKLEHFFKPSGSSAVEAETSSSEKEKNSTSKTPDDEPKDDSKSHNTTEDDGDTMETVDVKDDIKNKFKVEMPQDFYDLWEFCKDINPGKPSDALLDTLGLQLVGPYDVLSGVFRKHKGATPCYVLHWRYYYDPPEFQTVVRGDAEVQHHLGYYRDDPKELPAFVGSNQAKNGCNIYQQGDNLFAAVKLHIDKLTKSVKDKKKLEAIKDLGTSLMTFAKKKDYCLDLKSKSMLARNKKVVTKTFHGAGIVVPIDENDVGYRELPETDAGLKKMLKKIVDSKRDDERMAHFDPLQEIITFVQFANDECDYGEGLELGLDLFANGSPIFHTATRNLLTVAYSLLGRDEFGEIIEAHLDDRRKDNVSQLS